VNPSDIDFEGILYGEFNKLSDRVNDSLNFHPNSLVCSNSRHLSGGTAHVVTDTVFGSDIDTVAVTGETPVEVGDLILRVTRTAGLLEVLSTTIGYHTYSGT